MNNFNMSDKEIRHRLRVAERLIGRSYPQTRKEAMENRKKDPIGAALYICCESAANADSDVKKMAEINYSSRLLGIEIPEGISRLPATQAVKEWIEYLRYF